MFYPAFPWLKRVYVGLFRDGFKSCLDIFLDAINRVETFTFSGDFKRGNKKTSRGIKSGL